MSAPTNVVFSILEAKPCKGTTGYKLLCKGVRKPRGVNDSFNVKTKGLELQRFHQVLSERAVGLSKAVPSVGLQQNPNKPVKDFIEKTERKRQL